jgi:hypothetical protein
MQKLRGLTFASALLFAGGAQAFDNNHANSAAKVDIFGRNANTPRVHLHPQPLPPGMQGQAKRPLAYEFYYRTKGAQGMTAPGRASK